MFVADRARRRKAPRGATPASLLEYELRAAFGLFDGFMEKEAAVLNAQLAARRLPAVSRLTREEWEKRRSS